MNVTLAQAEEIVREALVEGTRLGKALSVAVVDSGGFTVLIQRSDGARPLTPSIAQAKAYTSAVMQRPSRMLKGWQDSNPVFFSQISQLANLPIVATDGGVTLKRDGEIIGGLGISGGTAEEDQEVADATLERLGYTLDFPAWGKPATPGH